SLNSKPSSITIGSAYTQNKQILLYLPYNLFLKNDQYRLTGEVGYYKYNFFYFGVGNCNDTSARESYEVTFPRLRLNAYKRISQNMFVGLKYGYDHFQDLKFDPNGDLRNSTISGVKGGVNSAVGLGMIYDSRDHPFYPRNGFLADVSFGVEDKWTGSDFSFNKLNVDITNYYSLTERSVLASNLNIQAAHGDIPFYMMSLLGGGKRLRGQFEGQQRDLKSLQSQVEWRQEFLKNWGFTLFAGAGLVANNYDEIGVQRVNCGYGAGLRYKLDKKEHVNIRLDVGFGGGQILPYFTISEAF
ncbi:MAG: outer membrane protein assembly factor, partial [Bacteroidetes bacterium]|nr:outer membrane protein assembly factor [Bacteroidota bacterium]